MATSVLPHRYELRAVDELQLHPQNARRGDVAAIAESIESVGFYGALIVQQSTGFVLAGNHRLIAAQQEGIDELPVLVVDVDDDVAQRIMLGDNRYAELATWDEQQLIDVLSALAAGDDGLRGTGFTTGDLVDLLQPADGESLLYDVDAGDEQRRDRPTFPVYGSDVLIEAGVEHWRRAGFPYPALSRFDCMLELNALAACPTERLRNSKAGYAVADTYHPHRYSVRIPPKLPAAVAWERDDKLQRGVRLCVEQLWRVSPGLLRGMMSLVAGTQTAANFRPAFALLLLRRFAEPGSVVLDTSTGFGGRLVGFLASECSTYVGIDPASVTVAANRKLCDDLLPVDKHALLIEQPAEDVDASSLPVCDIAVTSPPYFTKEHYSDESTQSCVRYTEPESWRDGFLRPMLQLQYDVLRDGAYSLLNVNDVEVRKTVVPLVDWSIECARAVGFELVSVDEYKLARHLGQGDDERSDAGRTAEPVIVLRK